MGLLSLGRALDPFGHICLRHCIHDKTVAMYVLEEKPVLVKAVCNIIFCLSLVTFLQGTKFRPLYSLFASFFVLILATFGNP